MKSLAAAAFGRIVWARACFASFEVGILASVAVAGRAAGKGVALHCNIRPSVGSFV